MSYHPLADKHNQALSAHPYVLDHLSEYGKAIFFPSQGILAQGAEAQKGAHLYNATIGIATEKGKAMALPTIASQSNLNSAQYLPYAPSYGRPDLRAKWQQLLLQKNPSLEGKTISLPVVTNALTHGLNVAGMLLLDKGDVVITSDHYWDNYDLLFTYTLGANIVVHNTFTPQGAFDVQALLEVAKEQAKSNSKITIILNFPNNPTGYSLTKSDAEALTKAVLEIAEGGTNVNVICDDAYFGLFFEPEVSKESVFAQLADLHERVLAVKVCGATKEDYVWGLRVGFITYACKGADSQVLAALEHKTAGVVRATVSNISNLSQLTVFNSLENGDYAAAKSEKFSIMFDRYQEVRKVLDDNPQYQEYFVAYPFNSGYFMCVQMQKGIDADEFRKYLIEKKGIGTIALGAHNIRVAYSCLEVEQVANLFALMHEAAVEFAAGK